MGVLRGMARNIDGKDTRTKMLSVMHRKAQYNSFTVGIQKNDHSVTCLALVVEERRHHIGFGEAEA